jgi:hypothetical protein
MERQKERIFILGDSLNLPLIVLCFQRMAQNNFESCDIFLTQEMAQILGYTPSALRSLLIVHNVFE